MQYNPVNPSQQILLLQWCQTYGDVLHVGFILQQMLPAPGHLYDVAVTVPLYTIVVDEQQDVVILWMDKDVLFRCQFTPLILFSHFHFTPLCIYFVSLLPLVHAPSSLYS